MKAFSIRKNFKVILAVLFFVQNAVLLHAAESNIWSQRKKQREKQQEPAQLASLSLPGLVKPGSAFPSKRSVLIPNAKDLVPSAPWLPGAVASHADIHRVHLSNNKEAKTVFLMQDAHLQLDAQKSIAGSLTKIGNVLKKQGSHLIVGMEATDVKTADYSFYNEYPHREAQNVVAEALLEADVINGVEFAAIGYMGENPNKPVELPFEIIGLENKAEYDANVEALRAAVPLKSKAEAALSAFKQQLTALKKKHYSSDLFVFDAKQSGFADQSVSVPDYALYLDRQVPASTKSIRELIEAYLIEEVLDYEKVEAERTQILTALVPKLKESDVSTLAQLSGLFKSGEVTFAEYYDYLKSVAKQNGVPFKKYPELNLYIQYVLKSDAIDPVSLFEEIRELETAVRNKVARTREQKQIAALADEYNFLVKLKDHALTEEEWHLYLEKKHEISQIPNRLASLGAGISPELEEMMPRWSVFDSFYQAAVARNSTMADRIASRLKESDSQFGAIVAGGFHTQGLVNELKEKNLNIVTLTPKISQLEDGPTTLDFLAKNKTPLDQLFTGEQLFINLVPNTPLPGTPEWERIASFRSASDAITSDGAAEYDGPGDEYDTLAFPGVSQTDDGATVIKTRKGPITIKPRAGHRRAGFTLSKTMVGLVPVVAFAALVSLVVAKIITLSVALVSGGVIIGIIALAVGVVIFVKRIGKKEKGFDFAEYLKSGKSMNTFSADIFADIVGREKSRSIASFLVSKNHFESQDDGMLSIANNKKTAYTDPYYSRLDLGIEGDIEVQWAVLSRLRDIKLLNEVFDLRSRFEFDHTSVQGLVQAQKSLVNVSNFTPVDNALIRLGAEAVPALIELLQPSVQKNSNSKTVRTLTEMAENGVDLDPYRDQIVYYVQEIDHKESISINEIESPFEYALRLWVYVGARSSDVPYLVALAKRTHQDQSRIISKLFETVAPRLSEEALDHWWTHMEKINNGSAPAGRVYRGDVHDAGSIQASQPFPSDKGYESKIFDGAIRVFQDELLKRHYNIFRLTFRSFSEQFIFLPKLVTPAIFGLFAVVVPIYISFRGGFDVVILMQYLHGIISVFLLALTTVTFFLYRDIGSGHKIFMKSHEKWIKMVPADRQEAYQKHLNQKKDDYERWMLYSFFSVFVLLSYLFVNVGTFELVYFQWAHLLGIWVVSSLAAFFIPSLYRIIANSVEAGRFDRRYPATGHKTSNRSTSNVAKDLDFFAERLKAKQSMATFSWDIFTDLVGSERSHDITNILLYSGFLGGQTPDSLFIPLTDASKGILDFTSPDFDVERLGIIGAEVAMDGIVVTVTREDAEAILERLRDLKLLKETVDAGERLGADVTSIGGLVEGFSRLEFQGFDHWFNKALVRFGEDAVPALLEGLNVNDKRSPSVVLALTRIGKNGVDLSGYQDQIADYVRAVNMAGLDQFDETARDQLQKAIDLWVHAGPRAEDIYYLVDLLNKNFVSASLYNLFKRSAPLLSDNQAVLALKMLKEYQTKIDQGTGFSTSRAELEDAITNIESAVLKRHFQPFRFFSRLFQEQRFFAPGLLIQFSVGLALAIFFSLFNLRGVDFLPTLLMVSFLSVLVMILATRAAYVYHDELNRAGFASSHNIWMALLPKDRKKAYEQYLDGWYIGYKKRTLFSYLGAYTVLMLSYLWGGPSFIMLAIPLVSFLVAIAVPVLYRLRNNIIPRYRFDRRVPATGHKRSNRFDSNVRQVSDLVKVRELLNNEAGAATPGSVGRVHRTEVQYKRVAHVYYWIVIDRQNDRPEPELIAIEDRQGFRLLYPATLEEGVLTLNLSELEEGDLVLPSSASLDEQMVLIPDDALIPAAAIEGPAIGEKILAELERDLIRQSRPSWHLRGDFDLGFIPFGKAILLVVSILFLSSLVFFGDFWQGMLQAINPSVLMVTLLLSLLVLILSYFFYTKNRPNRNSGGGSYSMILWPLLAVGGMLASASVSVANEATSIGARLGLPPYSEQTEQFMKVFLPLAISGIFWLFISGVNHLVYKGRSSFFSHLSWPVNDSPSFVLALVKVGISPVLFIEFLVIRLLYQMQITDTNPSWSNLASTVIERKGLFHDVPYFSLVSTIVNFFLWPIRLIEASVVYLVSSAFQILLKSVLSKRGDKKETKLLMDLRPVVLPLLVFGLLHNGPIWHFFIAVGVVVAFVIAYSMGGSRDEKPRPNTGGRYYPLTVLAVGAFFLAETSVFASGAQAATVPFTVLTSVVSLPGALMTLSLVAAATVLLYRQRTALINGLRRLAEALAPVFVRPAPLEDQFGQQTRVSVVDQDGKEHFIDLVLGQEDTDFTKALLQKARSMDRNTRKAFLREIKRMRAISRQKNFLGWNTLSSIVGSDLETAPTVVVDLVNGKGEIDLGALHAVLSEPQNENATFLINGHENQLLDLIKSDSLVSKVYHANRLRFVSNRNYDMHNSDVTAGLINLVTSHLDEGGSLNGLAVVSQRQVTFSRPDFDSAFAHLDWMAQLVINFPMILPVQISIGDRIQTHLVAMINA